MTADATQDFFSHFSALVDDFTGLLSTVCDCAYMLRGVCLCRFRVRADSQHPVSGGIPRSSRPHGNVHRNCKVDEFGSVYHVRLSASHSTRLTRVITHTAMPFTSFAALLPACICCCDDWWVNKFATENNVPNAHRRRNNFSVGRQKLVKNNQDNQIQSIT